MTADVRNSDGTAAAAAASRRGLSCRTAFASGWLAESIEPARFEVVPGIIDTACTPGGVRACFVSIGRAG